MITVDMNYKMIPGKDDDGRLTLTAAPDRHISFSKVNDPKGIRTPVNRRLAEHDDL